MEQSLEKKMNEKRNQIWNNYKNYCEDEDNTNEKLLQTVFYAASMRNQLAIQMIDSTGIWERYFEDMEFVKLNPILYLDYLSNPTNENCEVVWNKVFDFLDIRNNRVKEETRTVIMFLQRSRWYYCSAVQKLVYLKPKCDEKLTQLKKNRLSLLQQELTLYLSWGYTPTQFIEAVKPQHLLLMERTKALSIHRIAQQINEELSNYTWTEALQLYKEFLILTRVIDCRDDYETVNPAAFLILLDGVIKERIFKGHFVEKNSN